MLTLLLFTQEHPACVNNLLDSDRVKITALTIKENIFTSTYVNNGKPSVNVANNISCSAVISAEHTKQKHG